MGDQQSNNPTSCTIFLFLKSNSNMQSVLQENPKRRSQWKRKKEVDLQGLEGWVLSINEFTC